MNEVRVSESGYQFSPVKVQVEDGVCIGLGKTDIEAAQDAVTLAERCIDRLKKEREALLAFLQLEEVKA